MTNKKCDYNLDKTSCDKDARYEAIGMTRHLGYRCEEHKHQFISRVDLYPLQ